MQNYIPGDWFVSNTNSSLISSNNGEQHNWQMANVCQVYGMNDEQRQATAKLIAAALEMLEALISVQKYLNGEDILAPHPKFAVNSAIEKAIK